MKKVFFILSFLLFATFTFAQQAINQTLIDYLDNLDKAQVPTGILVEQGFPMYDLQEYKGQVLTDSNKIDADLFGWLYMGLAAGNVNDNTVIPDPQAYTSMYNSLYMGGGNLPIAILNYRYNYIKANALSQNLVYLTNGKMYDTPNRTTSPYGEANLFIASPMSPNSNTANVTFSIPNNLYFSNQASTLQSIEVDLGDGSGYRAVGLGQTVSAYYGANGEKALKVKCTLANGQVFESHSVLNVQDASLDINLAEAPPFSYNSTPDIPNETNVAGCKLSYFFHCPQQGLQKPFVFIEGFDPTGEQNFNAMIRRLGRNDNLVPQNQPSNTMLQRLYDEGYDLIYVDFTNGAGDIPLNAEVVKNVIRRINTLKAQNGSTLKTRVLGASMGGVVGKWAIREMERDGENHDIDKFIAFDSPLRGANVPMGIQFLVKDLDTRTVTVTLKTIIGQITSTKELKEYIPAIAGLKALLTAPAAKQMLFYSAFTPSGNPREFHDAFYDRLAALGDLQVDYSVVSNGSSINQPQLLNAGELYASITGLGRTPVRLFERWRNGPSIDVAVTLRLNPSAIPASGNGSVYTGLILMLLPGEGNPFIDVSSPINSTVSNLKPLDSAPGGFTNFDFPSQVSGISFNGVTIRGNFGTKTKGLWCFVPTFSALDIPEPTNVNQTFNCTNSLADRCIGSIDALAFSKDIGTGVGGFEHNQDHVSINQRNATFLLNQLATGAGLNNLTGSLTRTYNFGVSDETPSQTIFQPTSTPNVISRGLTVEGTGKLWVNRSGRINFTDQNNLSNRSNATFNLAIRRGLAACVVGNTSVIIKDGGTMQLGDPSVFNTAITNIETGATLDIQSGGNLQIEGNSQLIVESGGKLILNGGANVNIVGLESKIIIKNGGELIINGDFDFLGSGYFSFESGNQLTLNTDWTLTGSGKNTRLINVENNAEITVNNGRRWTIKEALIRKVGASGNNDVLLFDNGSTFFAENVTFDDQVSGGCFSFVADYEAVDLDNNPDDMEFSFRNCAFGNTAYAVIIGGFDNGNRFDFRNLNVEFVNSTFTNCQQAAYYAEQGRITTFDNCTITGGGIDVSKMYWLQMRNTTMRGGTIGANKIGVKLSFSIHNWIRENCLISGYATGIDALTGINGNIILSDKTTIQSCGTAIKQNGGSDYGLLYMDCTAILENQNGITGTDILLSAYSRGNTANIYRRPLNNSTSRFFNNTFQVRQETDIWLFGSYWDNPTYNASLQPPATSVNNFWRFMNGNNNWTGTLHLENFATIADVNNCGGIQLRDADNDSLARANAIVLVNGEYRNVRIQQNAALSQLRQNNLENAINLFSPVAGIVNGVRDTANSVVRYFVDVARVMAQGSNGVTIRSKSKGWLPETLVEMPKMINEFIVYPNPASNAVQLSIKNGNYHLRVSNAVGQTIFAQNTEGVLSVNVATWTNGIYLFELTDKATNKRQRSKIVVQH